MATPFKLSLPNARSIATLLLAVQACQCMALGPAVVSVEPPQGTTDVSPAESVRVEYGSGLDLSTLGGLRLLGMGGAPTPVSIDTDATLAAAQVTPLIPLQPTTQYAVDTSRYLRGATGEAAAPSVSTFTTGVSPIGSPGSEYRFSTSSLGALPSVTSVALGPDGNLYASDGIDSVWRYPLDPATGLASGAPQRVYQEPEMQTVGIAFSPNASAENLVLYTSHASRDNGNTHYTGTVSRLTIPALGAPGSTLRQDMIVGLPHPEALNHQPNGLTFGPDGRLYHAIGGLATLGGSPNWGVLETPLSAAVLVADVEGDPRFAAPVDVNTSAGYDPYVDGAPVEIFATGLRNAYDVAWHSNGHLYSGINGNSLNGVTTPDDPDQPGNQAIGAKEHEMLALVREGLYYGHPNPSRGEYILNGGNPTGGDDGAWEVGAYSVGVDPEPNFAGLPGTLAPDGSASGSDGLIYDVRPTGGNSPNGLAEYDAPGALNGRLLVSYFSGSRTIQTFELDPSSGLVVGTRPLENVAAQPLTLNGPLDLTVDSESGRVYVADFGLQADFGQAGRVVMLDPVSPDGPVGEPPTPAFTQVPQGSNPLRRAFDGAPSTDDTGIDRYVWEFGDGTWATGVAPSHAYPRDGRYTARLTVVDLDGQATSTETVVTVGQPREALLVVGDTFLGAGDSAVQARLRLLGFDVSVVFAGASTSADAVGKDVVLISSTSNSGQVNTKFTQATTGVVTWESFLFDDLRLTGATQEVDYGLTGEGQATMDISPTSVLGAGYAESTVVGVGDQAFWGVPGPAAEVVATLSGDPSRATFFTYGAGDQLADGSTAPGRRAGFFLSDTAAANFSGAGWELFDNAVLFAAGDAVHLPGDFNGDGDVDAADYVTWRDGLGVEFDAHHLDLWRSRYGLSVAAPARSAPEPGAIWALFAALTTLRVSHLRSRRQP